MANSRNDPDTAARRLQQDTACWVVIGLTAVALATGVALTRPRNYHPAPSNYSVTMHDGSWPWMVAILVIGVCGMAITTARLVERYKPRASGRQHARDVWQRSCGVDVDWVLSGGTYAETRATPSNSAPGEVAGFGLGAGQAGFSAAGLPGGLGNPIVMPLLAIGAGAMAVGGLMGLAGKASQAKRDKLVTTELRRQVYRRLTEIRDHIHDEGDAAVERRAQRRFALQMLWAEDALQMMREHGWHKGA